MAAACVDGSVLMCSTREAPTGISAREGSCDPLAASKPGSRLAMEWKCSISAAMELRAVPKFATRTQMIPLPKPWCAQPHLVVA